MSLVSGLAILVTLSCCAWSQTPAPAAGSISGILSSAGSGKPLGDVALILVGPSGRQQTRTSASGSFTFTGLPAGFYQLTAHGSAADILGTKSIAVDTGQSVSGVNLKVVESGSIAGRLLDENREPVTGLRVDLMGNVYQSGALKYQLENTTRVDQEGRYVLRGIRAGEAYMVVAHADSARTDAVSKAPDDSEERQPAAAETWYPDAPSAEGATALILFPGEQREGIDIRVRKKPARCIEGTLDGQGFLNFELLDSAGVRLANGTTEADGRLRLCQPERGALGLVAFRLAGDPIVLGSASIPAGDEDVKRLRLIAKPASSLPVEVVWAGDPPTDPPAGTISLSLTPADRTPVPLETRNVKGKPVPGAFTIDPLGDDYLFSVAMNGLPNGYYVKEATYGGTRLESNRLHLAGGVLRLAIARDGGSLTVNVQDSEGKPVSDVWVVVTPAAATTEAEMSVGMYAGVTNRLGVFSAGTVKPGKYLAIATTTWLDLNRETIARLWQARAKAKEIEIGPSASVQVTLPFQ